MSEIEPASYHLPVSRDGDWILFGKDSSGSIYERIVKTIFEDVLTEDPARTIEIRRNVILKGKTAQHQIDVFWRFEAGGIEYVTIVQAKDWSSKVKLGDLLLFKAVLDDIPNQARGIYVTRTGYQKGARTFARAHGIKLFELAKLANDPRPKFTMNCHGFAEIKIISCEPRHSHDKTNSPLEIKQFLLTKVTIHNPTFKPTVYVSEEWLRNQAHVPLVNNLRFPTAPPNEIYFYDEQGSVACSLGDIYRELLDTPLRGKDGFRTHNFVEPTYIETEGSTELPRVKISGILVDVTYDIEEHLSGFMTAPSTIELMLRDLEDGKARFFRVSRAVLENEHPGHATR